MRQIAAAAASKRRRNWILSRTSWTKAFGMWKVLGLPSMRTEIWYWVCSLLPSAQWQFCRPQARLVFHKRARQHFAEQPETAEESAAQLKIWIAGHNHHSKTEAGKAERFVYLQRIIVSE